MIEKLSKVVVLLIMLSMLVSCSPVKDTKEADAVKPTSISEKQVNEKSSNTVIIVSNQSFKDPQVKISIYVDEKPFVEDNFKVENQHTWKNFYFNLPKATHKMEVKINDKLLLTKEFKIEDKKQWLLIEYWNDKNSSPNVTYQVLDERPIFK